MVTGSGGARPVTSEETTPMLLELHTSSRRPRRDGLAPGRITLRDYGPGSHQRYVTHFHNTQDNGYYHGTYHGDLASATRRYEDRCAEYRVAPYPLPASPAAEA